MRLTFEEATRDDLARVLGVAADLALHDPGKKRFVLGSIRVRGKSGLLPVRVLFDRSRSYPWAASYERGRIVLDGEKFLKNGRLQENDLRMALLHELSHAEDEQLHEGLDIYRRIERSLVESGKVQLFRKQLDAALTESGTFEDAFLSGKAPIEVRAQYRAKLSIGDARVVSLLALYGIPKKEMEKFLALYLLRRSEDRMVEGYSGADGDYFRSEGEVKARMTTMYAEASDALGAERDPSKVLAAVKATRSFRALRRNMSGAQLRAISKDVQRELLRS